MTSVEAMARAHGPLYCPPSGAGPFKWKQRFSIHLAYHRDPVNRLLNLVAVQAASFGILLLLAMLPPLFTKPLLHVTPFGPLTLDWPFLGSLLFTLLCNQLDAGGACFQAAVLLLWRQAAICTATAATPSTALAVSFCSIVLLNLKILKIKRHWQLEQFALGDSPLNFRESLRNPVPVLLIIFYTNLEVLLELGYRPALAADIYQGARILRSKLEKAAGSEAPSAADAPKPKATTAANTKKGKKASRSADLQAAKGEAAEASWLEAAEAAESAEASWLKAALAAEAGSAESDRAKAAASFHSAAASWLDPQYPSEALRMWLGGCFLSVVVGFKLLDVSMDQAMKAQVPQTTPELRSADFEAFHSVLSGRAGVQFICMLAPMIAQMSRGSTTGLLLMFASVVTVLTDCKHTAASDDSWRVASLALASGLMVRMLLNKKNKTMRPSLILLTLTAAMNGSDLFFDLPFLLNPDDLQAQHSAVVNNTYHMKQFIHTLVVPVIVFGLTVEYLMRVGSSERRNIWSVAGLCVVALGAPVFLLGVQPCEEQLVEWMSQLQDARAAAAQHTDALQDNMMWIGFGHLFNTISPLVCITLQLKELQAARIARLFSKSAADKNK